MKAKILYIEDNEDNRRLMERLLTAHGLVCLSAEDAAEGLRMAAAEQPDLILMDINLPGLDGYEATAKLRATPAGRSVPIVALTANAMEGDRERALSAGCDGYLAKPIDVDTLVPALLGFLEGRRETLGLEQRAQFLGEHNLRLVEKLERKIQELESANQNLERLVEDRTGELREAQGRVVDLERTRAVAELAGTVAHELNQPLSILTGFSELLEQGLGDAPERREQLSVLQRQVARMAAIIQKLQQITRYETKPYYRGRIINLDQAAPEPRGALGAAADQAQAERAGQVLSRRAEWLETEVVLSESREAGARLVRKMLREFNNLLQGVRGFADLLLTSDDERGREHLAFKLSEATDRCIDFLRDFYRVFPMKGPGADDASAAAVVADVVDVLRKLYSSSGVAFVLHAAGDDLRPRCEPSEFLTLVLRLLQGSAANLPPSGGTVRCVVGAGASGRLALTVTDDGPPLPEDPFVVAERRSTGSLADEAWVERMPSPVLTRRLAERLGGSFGVGQGADGRNVFTLELPVAPATAVQPGRVVALAASRPAPVPGARILVVDDEEPICYIMRRHLEGAGVGSVDTCGSVEAALDLLARTPYDLVLLDLNLPGRNGLEALPELRSRWPALKVVIVTGLISGADGERALEQGASFVLLKPVRKQELLDTVARLGLPGVDRAASSS